jgi:hypothetical protein
MIVEVFMLKVAARENKCQRMLGESSPCIHDRDVSPVRRLG